jgi:TPR repeat protein
MVQFVEDRSCITQFELGEMFQQGDARTRDYSSAFKWYMKSAKRGYRRAQHRLGTMYARGTGVTRNYIKAYAWCKVSALQHSRRALLKLKKIEPYLSIEQISCARRLSKQYYESYVVPFSH